MAITIFSDKEILQRVKSKLAETSASIKVTHEAWETDIVRLMGKDFSAELQDVRLKLMTLSEKIATR